MEKKKFVFMVGFIFILALTFLLAKQSTSNASECRIVRIISFASDQNLTLTPDTSYINKGDCVVWFNNVAGTDVQIVFENGKECTDTVEASMDFKLDENSCLITNTYLTTRGTASFAFDKKGTFDYVVVVKGTNMKIKGQINVR